MKTLAFVIASTSSGASLTLLGMILYNEALLPDLSDLITQWLFWSGSMAVGFATILKPYFELWYQRVEDDDSSGGGAA